MISHGSFYACTTHKIITTLFRGNEWLVMMMVVEIVHFFFFDAAKVGIIF